MSATRYPGRAVRTRDAIEQTTQVLSGTITGTGNVSPGPPGAHDIDGATLRVDQVLTPNASTGVTPGQTVSLSYTRQVFPESEAEAELQQGQRYVLFCRSHGRAVVALKAVPHSREQLRIVASAFRAGARHGGGTAPGTAIA